MTKKYVHPYAETFDSFGVSTSDVYDGGNDVRPSFGDVPVGHDASPSPMHGNTPHYSYGGTLSPPLVESNNGQSPIHEFNFGQPSSRVYGSTREQIPKNKGHNHDRTNIESTYWQQQSNKYQQDPEQCRSQNKAAEREIETLKMRLFYELEEAKKYGKAEELYHEISKKYDVGEESHYVTERGRESDRNEDTKIRDLKHTFAGMLIEQKRFEEAEPISKAIWEKMKHCLGQPSEDFKNSHRQLCFVLRALRKLKDAEKMHNDMYQREPKDDWALENGDEVCQRRKEQHDLKRAKDVQEEVFNARLETTGSRDFTIRSGLRLVGFLEELATPIDSRGSTDVETRLCSHRRETYKCETEVTLRDIWKKRQQSEMNAEMLDAGHKLGVLLLQDNKFSEAEGIFASVWERKKGLLGEANDSTMSSGSMLGSTICRQGKLEDYSRAVRILQPIWLARQNGTEKCDAGAISNIKDLAHAYCSLRNLHDGECVYRWVCHQKNLGGHTASEVNEALWDLGVTLYKQGKDKEHEAVDVLTDLYQRLNRDAYNPDETLKCGQLLAQSLSTQDGKIDEALKVAQDVFQRREVSGKRGVAYLESAQLYGSLLLKVERHEDAGNVLRSAWECQAGDPKEQRLRLKCGHLYGQALAGRNKYTTAKKILDAVAADQKGTLPAGSPELTETRRLLEVVIRQEKGWKRGRTKARPKGRSGI